jgi:hypothetical protein
MNQLQRRNLSGTLLGEGQPPIDDVGQQREGLLEGRRLTVALTDTLLVVSVVVVVVVIFGVSHSKVACPVLIAPPARAPPDRS